jgi:iron complex transport system substrate-binding protein
MHALRIVSLLSSATEMLCLLGATEQLLAISHECDYPAEILGRPRATHSTIRSQASSQEIDQQVHDQLATGQSLYELNVALLCELRPDLIVTQAQCDVCAIRFEDVQQQVQTVPALAKTQLLAFNPTSLDGVLTDIRLLGAAIQRSLQANELVASLQQRVEFVKQRTAMILPAARPRVACIEWTAPLMLAGNWMPELVEWAGGQQPCTPREHSRYWTWEELRDYDPEVILVTPCGFDLARSWQESRPLGDLPGWESTTAARRHRVYVADGNAYFNRSGPRLVDSLEMLATFIHPSLFTDEYRAAPWQCAWKKLDDTVGN